MWELEGVSYLCSVNKGTDQLRGYHAGDLRPYFHACKKTGIVIMWPIYTCNTLVRLNCHLNLQSLFLTEGAYNFQFLTVY